MNKQFRKYTIQLFLKINILLSENKNAPKTDCGKNQSNKVFTFNNLDRYFFVVIFIPKGKQYYDCPVQII